jgi:hypothetical protein
LQQLSLTQHALNDNNAAALMSATVPFFPPSQPDETLNSRVSRYHVMAGNSTFGATLDELFGNPLTGLDQAVPPGIDVLAMSLPGDPRTNLLNILSENTLLPLFQPFIGHADGNASQQGLLSRLPRRVVGKHGEAYLCVQCLREDEKTFGIGYWHRAHHAPGVTACWKHRTQLLRSCPVCRLPFQRKYKLLDATWNVCPKCANNLFEAPAGEGCSDNAYLFATFVHDLIDANCPPVPPDVLALAYRTQIQSIGFARGSKTALTAFTESLVAALGEDFIRSVDPAYATGKTKWWLRFNYYEGGMDMPITRHILLSMHLFGTADRFLHAVRALLPTAEPASGRKKSGPIVATVSTMQEESRKRIRHEIKLDPGATMEKLWKKAYRATAWLFENDKKWLSAALEPKSSKPESHEPTQSDEDSRQDKHFASLVDARARQLIASKEKPQRVTLGRLLACLPITADVLRRREDRYPILSEQLGRCKESSWSFSARRVLWAIGEVGRLDMSVTYAHVVLTSSVSYYVVHKILNFCRWDFVAMAAQQINPTDELTTVGIGLTWQGPDSSAMNEVGGRAYVALTSRKSNKRVDLLHGTAADDAAAHESADQEIPAPPAAKRKRAA